MDNFHARKLLFQKSNHPPVFLNQQTVSRSGDRILRQCPKTRPQLQPHLPRLQPQLGDNPLRKVLIVQKILPKTARGFHPHLRKCRSNGREFHRRKLKAKTPTLTNLTPEASNPSTLPQLTEDSQSP